MIFGNPSVFAVQIDIVLEWCDLPSFIEGVVHVYARNILITEGVASSSIFVDVQDIAKGKLATPQAVGQKEFEMEKLCLSKSLLKARHPFMVFGSDEEYRATPDDWSIDIEEDLSKDATFETLSFYRCKLFSMKFEKQVRLLFVRFDMKDLEYFNYNLMGDDDVVDVIVNEDDLARMVDDVKIWYSKI